MTAAPFSLTYRYRLAKYPVTNAQFACFVSAADGYGNAGRWFEGLAADASDREIVVSDETYLNHPCVEVNWYQAMAFCRWLSWRMGGVYSLNRVLEWPVRLPTEMEWEIACRGSASQAYPYGDTYEPSKGNTHETGIGRTSAVGIFPEGISPYGVLDMSGNVWEWCLTSWKDGKFAPEAQSQIFWKIELLCTDGNSVFRRTSLRHEGQALSRSL